MTYYKAIRLSGTDFYSGAVRWAPRYRSAKPGSVVSHPWAKRVGLSAYEYLSASTVATDCTGMFWPCRLLEVEPVDESGQVIEPDTPEPGYLPNKRAAIRWRVVRELPAHEALGPQAEQIVALMKRASRLTKAEVADLDEQHAKSTSFNGTPDAWAASWHAANVESREASWDAIHVPSRDVASSLARTAIRNAAWALLVRDLIGQHGLTQEHYDTLTGPWRRAIGPIYPDDSPLDTATPA